MSTVLTPPHGHDRAEATVYHLPTIGRDTPIAEHFVVGEMACHDGTPVVLIHPALAYHLNRIRRHFGAPVKILSGFRTGAYNRDEGGVDNSTHLYGMAADVVVLDEDVSPSDVQAWADEQGFGGVGYYENFTHVDVWQRGRRWGPSL